MPRTRLQKQLDDAKRERRLEERLKDEKIKDEDKERWMDEKDKDEVYKQTENEHPLFIKVKKTRRERLDERKLKVEIEEWESRRDVWLEKKMKKFHELMAMDRKDVQEKTEEMTVEKTVEKTDEIYDVKTVEKTDERIVEKTDERSEEMTDEKTDEKTEELIVEKPEEWSLDVEVIVELQEYPEEIFKVDADVFSDEVSNVIGIDINAEIVEMLESIERSFGDEVSEDSEDNDVKHDEVLEEKCDEMEESAVKEEKSECAVKDEMEEKSDEKEEKSDEKEEKRDKIEDDMKIVCINFCRVIDGRDDGDGRERGKSKEIEMSLGDGRERGKYEERDKSYGDGRERGKNEEIKNCGEIDRRRDDGDGRERDKSKEKERSYGDGRERGKYKESDMSYGDGRERGKKKEIKFCGEINGSEEMREMVERQEREGF